MSQLTVTVSPIPSGGLAALGEVELDERYQAMLNDALEESGGPLPWRNRKKAEARELLALSRIAPRLQVQQLDLRESLRALLFLRTPVPLRPGEHSEFFTGNYAVLGLTYPLEALSRQQPGFAFLEILAPDNVWHANVSAFPVQRLCLGAQLPAGIRVKELVLMAYGALTMQTVQIDERDSAGVLNAEAAVWWQQNLSRLPLARVPFLGTEDLNGGNT